MTVHSLATPLVRPVGRRRLLERDLPGAFDRRELYLRYQPILDLVRLETIGSEALLRWRHPQLGLVAPAELLPIAAHLGPRRQLDAWVLDRASAQAASWHDNGLPWSLSVNVGRGRDDGAIVELVNAALDSSALGPSSLTIDYPVAGGALDDDCFTALEALRATGVLVALDGVTADDLPADPVLERLPVDCIKVDRGELLAADGAPACRAMLHEMVRRIRGAGLSAVVVGIETARHLEVARDAGFDAGQGFLFAHPEG